MNEVAVSYCSAKRALKVCVRVCVRARARMCACCERERERNRGIGGETAVGSCC